MRKSRGFGVVLAVVFGCSHMTDQERKDALQKSLTAIDPNAEPAPPRDPPEDGEPAFNTEYWLGTQQAEEAEIQDFGRQINELQKEAAQDHQSPGPLRGFHAKSHGCLHGELHLKADRDPRTRFGIFADDSKPLPVWVRFSNGVGWKQADDTLDARGMAVKVMGVEGPKYLDDEKSTQDFLMTNSPTPVGANAEEFMKFAHANISGRLAGLFFLVTHPRTAGPALTKTGAIDSAVTTQYWSGGAYHLGAHQAIKYTAKPCDPNLKRTTSHDDPDYLKKDLTAAAQDGVCMRFYVQFQVDPEETPIENASQEWEEDVSPLVPVGEIVMPKQELAPQEFCDGLAFNPWHAIRQHKPMGHINRARRVVYASSQTLRGRNPEPTPWAPPAAPPPAPQVAPQAQQTK